MGLLEDVTSREGLVASMQDVALKQFLFLRNLALPLAERFGGAGLSVLGQAIRHYGRWRGDNIRMAAGSIVRGHDALALFRNWDSCELVLAHLAGKVAVAGGADQASLALPRAPGAEYFAAHGRDDILEHYWSHLLPGMAQGYDEALQLASPGRVAETPWTLAARYHGAPAGRTTREEVVAALDGLLADPETALALIRRTSRNAGALYFFVAREAIRVYDAAGERLVRQGVRGIGRERGSALREKHLREGKPLNLKTLMLDWDGPLVSTWVFNGEGHLSAGTWHQDCRYCPYADVWSEFGAEGLALGYLYDVELHTTMYETYHPGTVVRWEALKTRGDTLCQFRFSIPELAAPGDPEFVPRPERP